MTEKFYSRPKDKSLRAFKEWINGIVDRINPNAEDTMTETEWEERWKKFWSKAEGTKDDSGTPATQE